MVLVQDSERVNYSPTNEARALPEPEDYDRADLLFTREDVENINRRLAHELLQYGAVRAQVALYRCPWPCTKATFAKVRDAAIKKWLNYMEKNGWALVSHVRLAHKSRWCIASHLRGDWYSTQLNDAIEIPIGAAFRKTDLRIVRTEVPVADR